VPRFLPDNADVRADIAKQYTAVDRLDAGGCACVRACVHARGWVGVRASVGAHVLFVRE
jgi:hypothetical protein